MEVGAAVGWTVGLGLGVAVAVGVAAHGKLERCGGSFLVALETRRD